MRTAFGVRRSAFGVLGSGFWVLGSRRRATLSAWPYGRPERPARHEKLRRIARALAFALAASGLSACRQAPPVAVASIPAGALRGDNVLLVTIDTLRADHIGA